MPGIEGLKPVSIKDFSPGLYNATDWLTPANGWQQMQDCYPQLGGGLRAFYAATQGAISTSGITAIGFERVIGMGQAGGIAPRAAGGIATDRYLVTYDFEAGVGTPRVYRRDGSNSATTWTFLNKSGGGILASTNDNLPGKASLFLFELANGNTRMEIIVRYTGSDNGLYRVDYISLPGVLTNILDGAGNKINGSASVHQARIVTGGGNGLFQWSDPGSETFQAASFLNLDPNKDGTRITALHGVEPSDLVVMREGAGFVVVQGDIANSPAVQVTNEGIGSGGTGFTDFCATPYGLAFISVDGYMYLTDGRTHTKISGQLSPFTQSPDFSQYGAIVYGHDMLFCPKGRVYDFRTKSWFTQTQIAGSCKSFDPFANELWGTVADGVNFVIGQINPSSSAQRVSTFTAKTAVLHGEDGRQTEMRQVDVYCKSYDANATISATCNGTTNTQLLRTAGQQQVRFLFRERAHDLDVQFVSTSGTAGNEAPSFDGVQLWTKSGHLTPN